MNRLFYRVGWREQLRIGLLTGLVVGLAVLLIWQMNWFTTARQQLTNVVYVPQPVSGNVVLVAIDDASLQAYGALLGWPRSRYADMLAALVEAEARVVAFDVLMAEPGVDDDVLAAAIQDASAAGVRTVFPAVGLEPLPDTEGLIFAQEITPIDAVSDHATFIAFVNAFADADGAVRREQTFARMGTSPDAPERLAFSLAAYLAYFNVRPTLVDQVITRTPAAITLPAGFSLAVDERGFWLQNFFGPPSMPAGGTFTVVSAAAVLDGSAPPAVFRDKVVLVGLMNATGAVDRYPTPISGSQQMMAGVEIIANAIETLFSGRPLREEGRVSQVLAIGGLALMMSVLYAQVRWFWMPVLLVIAGGLWLAYASVMFDLRGVVVNGLHPLLAITLTAFASLGVRVSLEVIQRQRVESLLQSVVQMSEQRLEVYRMLPFIVGDVQTMTHAQAGAIWLRDAAGRLNPVHVWGAPHDFTRIAERAEATAEPQRNADLLGVPVVWQGRVLALLMVHHAGDSRTQALLTRFAERIAPSMDNALLYAETQSQNQLLQGILTESPAGILVLDQRLTLLRCNDAVLRWLELGSAELVGQTLPDLLAASSIAPEHAETLVSGLRGGQAHFRTEIPVRNNTYQWEAARLSDGKRWVVTLSDITRLVEVDRLKTRMIRMASHDLKNPLGRVIGYAEMVEELAADGEGGPTLQKYIQRIVQAADEMNTIITEMLDLEYIRTHAVKKTPQDMVNIARNVIDRHLTDMEEHRHTFNSTTAADLPAVSGDFNQLVQALSNLLGNAIKYTPDGGQIDMRLYAQNGTVRVEVSDNGYGIPQKAQDKLFSEFYRAKTEQTRHIQGTGLGLSLVKSVIEAHEGKIWFESEENVGTTFYVELPALPPSA